MKDEIKEILDYLKKEVYKFEESKTYLMETYNYREQDIENIEQHKKYVYFKKLLDYITNLQEENERLKEDIEDISVSHFSLFKQYEDYKSRNEKANALLDEMLERAYIDGEYIMYDYSTSELLEVKQALEGEDKDVNITN